MLYTTSQRYIEAALMVKAIDDNWITISSEEDQQSLAQARRGISLYRFVYKIAMLMIMTGFLLQVVGYLVGDL